MNSIMATEEKKNNKKFEPWMRGDGKVCACLLTTNAELFAYMQQVNPNFLLESMDETIDFESRKSCAFTHLRLKNSDYFLTVTEKYCGNGWKVVHLLFYLRNDLISRLLEEGLAVPVKDELGRSLSDIVSLCEADFGVASFHTFYPNASSRLKLLEENQERKNKLFLFCCLTSRRNQTKKRSHLMLHCNEELLPKEILKLISEFLFVNYIIKGKLEIEVWR